MTRKLSYGQANDLVASAMSTWYKRVRNLPVMEDAEMLACFIHWWFGWKPIEYQKSYGKLEVISVVNDIHVN